MPYVISKDNGGDNPPSFLKTVNDGKPIWSTLDEAQIFSDESLAESVIEANELFFDTLIMPYDVEV